MVVRPLMPQKVSGLEIIRFLARTGGYISPAAIAGREAKVYGADYIKAAAYSIPALMLKAMISERLVEIAGATDERRYILTQKALHLAARRHSNDEVV